MEELFVPYKESLELKELGFNEPCFYLYKREKDNKFSLYQDDLGKWYRNADVGEAPLLWGEKYKTMQCAAPTFSQAFRWFRENKLCDMCICRYQSVTEGGFYYYYHITSGFGKDEIRYFKENFSSYGEAELECLRKLIKTCKNTN